MFFDSPVGVLEIEADKTGLRRLSFCSRRAPSASAPRAPSPMEKRIARQLQRYFDDPAWRIECPLHLAAATPFQQRVWKAIAATRRGQTLTYSEIAKRLHTHPRAVGGACRTNPVPIVVPCHRVIAKSGELRGYTGPTKGRGLKVKAWLLRHEGALE